MQEEFESSAQELRAVRDALAIEREAEREQFQNEWLALPLPDRIARGIALHPIVTSDQRLIIGDRWKIRGSYKPHERRHRFQSGQPIHAFKADDRCRGVLAWIGESELEIVLDDLPEWMEDGNYGIDLAFNETAYQEMERGIGHWIDVRNREDVLQRDGLLGYSKPAQTPATPGNLAAQRRNALHPFHLNDAQTEGALGVMATQDFAILHGPPGTGKTSTVVAAIATLAREGKRILATAPTNAAVDLIIERLGTTGVAPLRIGHPGRVDERAWQYTIDGQLDEHPESSVWKELRDKAEEVQRQANRYKRHFGPEERRERQALRQEYKSLIRESRALEKRLVAHIVRSARVVVATLTGANHPVLADQDFDVVFIDEAAQALEPAAWIAIRRARVIVLSGDHCQLPPTLLSNNALLSRTLFEKMIDRHQAESTRVFFLDVQYRMLPIIMGFSNAEFYGGRLRTHPSVEGRTSFEPAPFEQRLVFIDTAGADLAEEQDPESESRRNSGEAQLLVSIFAWFRERFHARTTAGIICPYRAQTILVKRLLRERNLLADGLLVDTVDSFQGGERDFISISCTRSNEQGEIGFLGEARRFNVAITRAREMLLLIGDSATLSYNDFFARLLEYVEKHGDYRSAFEFMND